MTSKIDAKRKPLPKEIFKYPAGKRGDDMAAHPSAEA